jgi:hypothetical protein
LSPATVGDPAASNQINAHGDGYKNSNIILIFMQILLSAGSRKTCLSERMKYILPTLKLGIFISRGTTAETSIQPI